MTGGNFFRGFRKDYPLSARRGAFYAPPEGGRKLFVYREFPPSAPPPQEARHG